MTSKKTTILMGAILAVATVLAAGLTVLPSSVQEAQANPCAFEVDTGGNEGQSGQVTANTGTDERECEFIGYNEFDED
jgi:hypothetical protein